MAASASDNGFEHVDPPSRRRARVDESDDAVRQPPTPGNTGHAFSNYDQSRLLDTKGLLKLPDFSGRDEDFVDWYEQFINVIAPMHLDEITEAVGRMDRPPLFSQMNEEQITKSKLLFTLLHHSTKDAGRATPLVRQAMDRNGFWAFWALCREYRAPSTDRLAMLYDGLTHPRWSEHGWYPQWLQWENDVARYEREARMPFPDRDKIVAIRRYSPKAIRKFIINSPVDICCDYGTLRTALRNYMMKTVNYSELGFPSSSLVYARPSPSSSSSSVTRPSARALLDQTSMEVDAAWLKGAGKGGFDNRPSRS